MKSDNSFQIRLRNAEGVPILDLGGNITKTALKAVKFTLEHLATAGHYNVVLNIEKAQSANWRFLMGLAGVVKKIQQHYGTVDLVATQDRVQQALQSCQVGKLFRLSLSEGQAISRIKGLKRPPEQISNTNARLK